MAQTPRTPHNARRQLNPKPSWLVFAASLGFLAGMLVMAAVVTIFPSGAVIVTDAPLAAAEPKSPDRNAVEVKPSLKETPPAVSPPEPELKSTEAAAVMSADIVEE